MIWQHFTRLENNVTDVLAVQNVLSGSGRAGRLCLMEKYLGHRLVSRPELDNTFWTDSTVSYFSNERPLGRKTNQRLTFNWIIPLALRFRGRYGDPPPSQYLDDDFGYGRGARGGRGRRPPPLGAPPLGAPPMGAPPLGAGPPPSSFRKDLDAPRDGFRHLDSGGPPAAHPHGSRYRLSLAHHCSLALVPANTPVNNPEWKGGKTAFLEHVYLLYPGCDYTVIYLIYWLCTLCSTLISFMPRAFLKSYNLQESTKICRFEMLW